MPSKGPITLQTDLLQKAASLPDLRLRVCNDVGSDSGNSSREAPPPTSRRHLCSDGCSHQLRSSQPWRTCWPMLHQQAGLDEHPDVSSTSGTDDAMQGSSPVQALPGSAQRTARRGPRPCSRHVWRPLRAARTASSRSEPIQPCRAAAWPWTRSCSATCTCAPARLTASGDSAFCLRSYTMLCSRGYQGSCTTQCRRAFALLASQLHPDAEASAAMAPSKCRLEVNAAMGLDKPRKANISDRVRASLPS